MKHIQEYSNYNNEGMEKMDSHSGRMENYMFFQNLQTMKREIEAMLSMDAQAIDHILHNGHSWASDHIATSTDDIVEVSNFFKNELEQDHSEMGEEPDSDDLMMVNTIVDPEVDIEEIEEGLCSECGGTTFEGYCPKCK